MRRRLVFSYSLLMILVLLALETPLAVTLANRETERLRADRLADANRFASLSGPALRSGAVSAIDDELRRYRELYGITAAVIDRERRSVVATGGLHVGSELTDQAVFGALAGRQMTIPEVVWPWQADPLVVAVPVNDGGEVIGAVVTVSSTNRVRRTVAVWWAALATIGLLAVSAGVMTAFRLAGWVLRPVTVLDVVTHDIAAGDGLARVPTQQGPPELRRLATSFNEMADAVADALERQRAFVAHASHQLRNPLTALRLRVEELGPSLTDEHGRDEHKLALEETDRLAQVLDGLLTLARAERAQHTMVVVNAATVAASRVAAWQPLANRHGIALRLRPGDGGPAYARAVPTAVDQVLDALIDNAVKFGRAGGRVDVSVHHLDEGVVVEVTDDGPGMTGAQLESSTERFWRAPDTQNIDGAGLGLTIVAVLVDASGGRLTMRPAEPTGLTAQVWFRAGEPPAPPRAVEAPGPA
ncbi:HAMP domain-containing histidine kinase [Plantactinospora sp. S1510]|uniref:histidine kinase n=1 Tax=Plantactinospora alkalitolerans TaxID=2789879 RepID=A0ABS0H2X4_9ACTN|nr:HAMP domain-containing sensor histidine kinase [Plantactinospora alkalitolerans]MBF9132489.1 HAMP domain-containing histidine kinase [Plantactinospora alkalitolerans]